MSVKKLLTPPLPLPYMGGELHGDCLQLGFSTDPFFIG